MRLAHLLTATAVAAGAVVATAAPAQAHPLDVVIVDGGASCPSRYAEIAQLDETTICWHVEIPAPPDIPEWKIVTNGTPCNDPFDSGWTEYSVLNRVRLCVRT